MAGVGVGAVLDASVGGVLTFGIVRPGVPFVGIIQGYGRGVSGEGERGVELHRGEREVLEEDWQGGTLC